MPGLVHVSGYQQRCNNLLVDVADHHRGAPAGGGGEKKPWHRYSNWRFREEIAKAERSSDKPHDGYREHARTSKALGRYQLTPIALADTGWRNLDGTWTREAREKGVNSDVDLLRNPAAQEEAMAAYLRRNDAQLDENRSKNHIGKRYTGHDDRSFNVTEGGLAAAAHREGPKRTKEALDKLKSKKAGNPKEFSDSEKKVIKRLHDFAEMPDAKP